LDQSLIYHATLGGKELSHSNIVAALAKKHSKAFAKFIAPFFGVLPEEMEILDIQRESRNLDIDIHLKIGNQHCGLTVENKLKALPEASQLIRYSDVKNKHRNNWRHVLLSLSKPAFFHDGIFVTPEKKTWVHISYKALGEAVEAMLDDIEHSSLADAIFAREYALVCKTLYEIQEQFMIDWLEDRYDFYNNDVQRILSTVRLHDLYAKNQYGKVAAKIENELSNVKVNGLKLVTAEGAIPKPNTAFVTTGYTHGQGLIDVKVGLPVSGFEACVGVQIQGGEMRLFFESESNKSSKKMAKELLERSLWFRFTNGEGRDKNGEFYHFKPAFFYHKKNIGYPLLSDLIAEVTALFEVIADKRMVIADTVSQFL
jgi:hypothetical protein